LIIFANVNERIVRIILILAILACSSCGTLSRAPKVAGQPTLADSVWVFSQSRPKGFTIDIRSWEEPREGISVAYQQTQNRHDRKDLDYVVSHAKEHDGYIGGWLNSEDGLYYFDSVRLFPEDSLSAAILFGKANHQDAVYKLSSKQEIRLIEDVEFVSPTNLIIMYDPEIGKEALLSAVKEYGAKLLYDYSLIPGIAIKIPEGTDIIEAIVFFDKVKGVTAVERDHIYHLIEPVKPRLEVM
jgi:hypothetical protein